MTPVRRPIKSITLLLTSRCNLRCRYCYQDAKSERSPSWSHLRNTFDWAMQTSGPQLEVIFSGGEPLLVFGLLHRAVRYVDATRPPDKQVCYKLLTNGTLLSPAVMEYLTLHEFDLQLSWDGIAAAQDRRGPGTFTALTDLLARLHRQHPTQFRQKLTVAMTVTPETVVHLADSFAFFLSQGVERISVTPTLTPAVAGPATPNVLEELTNELSAQFARIYALSLRHYRQHGRIPLLPFRRWDLEIPCATSDLPVCNVGAGDSPAMDVDGRLYSCVSFTTASQNLPAYWRHHACQSLCWGYPGTEGFDQRFATHSLRVRRLPLFTNKELKHSSYGRCGECSYLTVCQVCPLSIIRAPGNRDPLLVPDFACAFNSVLSQYRERFPACSLPPEADGDPVVFALRMQAWEKKHAGLLRARATAGGSVPSSSPTG
jgi:sulfatase maturation enzyme AslB (radical SAM superfamily)